MISKTEAIDMETKERENTKKMTLRENSGKYVERLDMKFLGKKYETQLTSTGKKRKYFMHSMQKLAVDVTFAQMTANKGIKSHGERAVSDMYKE